MAYLDFLLLIIYLPALLIQLLCLKFRAIGNVNELNSGNQKSPKHPVNQFPGISILVCAKNEAENLRKNLPAFFRQSYPSQFWEIVVVNDASTDKTEQVLNEFREQYSKLKVVTVESNTLRKFPGKKQALDAGINACTNDWVLLTDADCSPASDQWLYLMAVKALESKKSIILGYGAYEKQPTLLNRLIQWETLQTCIQYAGMFVSGMPYMGVGRNLMYAKALYFQALQDEAFKNAYATLPSGDDDLLIGKIATTENTGLCLESDAHTLSQPSTTYRQWFRQKTRHVSTGKYYPKKIKYLLGLSAFSQGLFWLMWLIICFVLLVPYFNASLHSKSLIWQISFLIGLVRIVLYWRNAKKWYSMLNAKKLVRSYPIGEICLSVFQLILSPYIFWKNKQQWK